MKKLLAVMAVFALVLMAQVPAAQAEVTIFGQVHMSVDMVDADNPAPVYTDSQLVVANNTSRIGFKGEEKLDNGMNLFWQIDTAVVMDGETNTLAARNRYLGIGGGFGKVLVGIHDTPYKLIGRKIELFPEYVGDARNVTSVGGFGWDLRPSNVIAYMSPKMGNAEIIAAYVTDSTNATPAIDNNDFSAMSVSISYTAGPLWAGFAYEKHDVSPTADETGMRVTASFDLTSDAKVVAFYQQLSDLGGVSGADRSDMGVGVSFAMGSNVLKAQYYKAGETGTNDGGSVMAIGADHKLSKSTTAYIAYASADNDSGTAAYMMNGGGHGDGPTPTATGGSPSAISIGMIYKF